MFSSASLPFHSCPVEIAVTAISKKHKIPMVLTSSKTNENVKLAVDLAIRHHQNPVLPKATSMKITLVSDPGVDRDSASPPPPPAPPAPPTFTTMALAHAL